MFQEHPDYAIVTSLPDLADSTGAPVLAEIGDDHIRFAEVRAMNAGTVTVSATATLVGAFGGESDGVVISSISRTPADKPSRTCAG